MNSTGFPSIVSPLMQGRDRLAKGGRPHGSAIQIDVVTPMAQPAPFGPLAQQMAQHPDSKGKLAAATQQLAAAAGQIVQAAHIIPGTDPQMLAQGADAVQRGLMMIAQSLSSDRGK